MQSLFYDAIIDKMNNMVIIVIVLLIAIAIWWFKQKRNDVPQNNPLITKHDYKEDQRSINEATRASDALDYEKEKAYDEMYVFKNHFRKPQLLHLTPQQAKKQLAARVHKGELLPSHEYQAYIEVIASENDDVFLSTIATMTPKQVHEWFLENRMKRIDMSSTIWAKVFEIVAPFHEPILIEEMKTGRPARIARWVELKKQHGYFFTDAAYAVAIEIFRRQKHFTQPESVEEFPPELLNKIKLELPALPDDTTAKEKVIDNLARSIRHHRKNMENPERFPKASELYQEHLAKYFVITGRKYQEVKHET
jgi:uncharacterized protein YxeA